MPPRTTPTERQKRLGAELRKMRMAAGVSTDYAAGLLGIDRSKISNIELGVRVITAARLRTLACNYACTDERYIDALVRMADDRERGWWERFRGVLPAGLLDIAELEWRADRVLTMQVVHLPGLLHTEDYARAIFGAVLPAMPRLEVELRVAHRMQRQQVFERSKPLPYVGFIHEAALRMQFGGRKVARDQLNYLLAMSDRPDLVLRVLPVERGAFPGSGSAVLYAEGSVPQLDTVQLDSTDGPGFVHAESLLSKYREHLDWMDAESLSVEQSRDFIRRVSHDL
ncbi:Scr1 family TA system antitoxin-like transcriptional regulator [Streptomyces albireticuli]|uniref:Transcriptional regulator n=1 Tax=Streptomyces albireticuli TaxID=1940 RepID=A0A2A2DDD9_9ACTN|nr:Scr1 family TA system antitoxin-like transcriptional regulator [Streptomyces albireticuli]MCD9141894.1 Scr1 family TA system antitoxin-like transcriptional regulator [Streptomyces albireticuli]MCD9163162.1 Scr1 family TA system antitoxin-like transcriptional regulator [Streptomyces albireticuli]MCD9190068.1 Scr1 family TA system antitoxin-like transcriptional regulator [Streptomyces albireticuli]PAU50473.1 transcriptional regulator [Streptomyces albireticuli]